MNNLSTMEHEFVMFNDVEYVLKRDTYPITNQIRLDLMMFNPEEGGFEPTLEITGEIEHIELEEGEVIIRESSENEGIVLALTKAGIIAKPHENIKQEFITFHICQLIN